MEPPKALQTTRTMNSTILHTGFEWSSKVGKMAFCAALGEIVVIRRCEAGDGVGLARLIRAVQEKFGIVEPAEVRSV